MASGDQWMQALAHDGVAILRSVVDPRLLVAARALIAAQLESDLSSASRQQVEKWTARSFVPGIESDSRLRDLFDRSPLTQMAGEALSPNRAAVIERVQVQVRLAADGPYEQLAGMQPVKQWHCDGISCRHLPRGTLNTFQLLLGILLSDVEDVTAGAAQFKLGGHVAMSRHFAGGGTTPADREVPPTVDDLPSVAFTGQAGDVVIAHHLTPHAVGANSSTDNRVMAYARVRVEHHDQIASDQLTEPWIAMPHVTSRYPS